MRNKKEDIPLSVISDMYNAEVEEHDKAGYADRLKEATEQFFKEVNETFDYNIWNVSPVHFSEIKYSDGYFVFGFGTNTVVHFHIDECPGWLFAIWWDIPDDSEELANTIKGKFFTQYEETLDKFKPSRSEICCDISVEFPIEYHSCDCYDACNAINFIRNEPALAFCRDYWGWDYNADYHTREEAELELRKYKEFAEKLAKYTENCDNKVLSFVRENVLPQFKDAEIRRDDRWNPEYQIVAPFESNKDCLDEPGMYTFFGDDEDGKALADEFASIIKECKSGADKEGLYWSNPIEDYVLVYCEDNDDKA